MLASESFSGTRNNFSQRTSIADGGEVEKPLPGNRSSIEKLSDEDKNKKPNSKRQAGTKAQ